MYKLLEECEQDLQVPVLLHIYFLRIFFNKKPNSVLLRNIYVQYTDTISNILPESSAIKITIVHIKNEMDIDVYGFSSLFLQMWFKTIILN